MKHYAVNYLKSDSSRTPQTIFVKAKNEEEAVDKAYDLVGGFYHGDADLITAKRAKQIAVRFNPPFYAHNLYEKKTHGLNLKQMRRLYAMVSRGNQKAITYARNVLGIPFSESPTQVKAVVYHHVRDLAERRGLKRNAPWSKVRNAFAKAGFQFHAYGKVDDPATGKKLYDYYKGDSLTDGQKKIIQSLIPEVEFGGSQSQYAPEIRRPVVMFPVKKGLRKNPARSHRERIAIDTVRHPMKGYFLGGPDLAESVRYLRSLGYSMAQLKKLNPEVEDILEGRKGILPNRRVKRNPFGGETLRSFKQKYKGFEIIVEIQPNTILATWTNGDILESDRFSGYELDEIFEEVKARIDALKRRRT